jgi:hypothetical protein
MRKFIAATLLTAFSVSANAALVDFYLSNEANYESSFSVERRGVTLSFSNANLDGLFDSDSDGLAIMDAAGSYFPAISEFNLSFDQAVSLISYEIEYLYDYGDESFTITGTNGTTTEPGPFAEGARDFDNSFIANAGEVLTWTSVPGAGGDSIIQVYSITVDTVPPPPTTLAEPATLALFTFGLAGIGVTRRRKQR